MQTVKIELDTATAGKFDDYVSLFGGKELMFNEFIRYHISRIKRGIAQMQADLDKYELKYSMKTADFYRQFENGTLGDDNDFMLWAGIYELQTEAKNKLSKLL